MNKRYMTGAVLAVFGVIALACGTGGGGPSSDTPEGSATDVGTEESATLSLGDTADNGQVKVTVDNLDFDVNSNNQFITSDNGTFATVDVTMEILGDKTTVSPTDWQLTASDGTTFSSELIVDGIDGVLEFQTLSAGQKTSGKVVFDVNEEAFADGKATVTYTPILDDPIVWNS